MKNKYIVFIAVIKTLHQLIESISHLIDVIKK